LSGLKVYQAYTFTTEQFNSVRMARGVVGEEGWRWLRVAAIKQLMLRPFFFTRVDFWRASHATQQGSRAGAYRRALRAAAEPAALAPGYQGTLALRGHSL